MSEQLIIALLTLATSLAKNAEQLIGLAKQHGATDEQLQAVRDVLKQDIIRRETEQG